MICFLLCILYFGTATGQNQNYYNDFKIVVQSGKSGITYDDRVALPCEYDEITRKNDCCFRIKQGQKYGLVSVLFYRKRQHSEKDRCLFTAPVKQGYISMIQSLPCEYDRIENTGSSLQLTKDNKMGLANSFGNRIVPCQYDQISMVDNKYYVTRGNKQGVFNYYGNTIIPCKYTAIEFKSNHYYVTDGNLHGVYNYYGNTVIPCKYDQIEFSNNHYYVTSGNLHGVYNYYGNTVIPCKYEEITAQSNRYIVKTGDKYGIINLYGNTILPCRYSKIDFLSNGNYVCTQEGNRRLYSAYGSLLRDYSDKKVIYSTDKGGK